MTVLENDVWHDYRMPADAIYNLYNAVASVATLRTIGYTPEQIAEGMEKLQVVQSRFWQEEIGNWELTEIMAKGLNAVACSRNFDYVANADGKKAVVLLLEVAAVVQHTLQEHGVRRILCMRQACRQQYEQGREEYLE